MSEKSIYDIPLKTWDGKDNMLEKYKGKVTLFANVSTECGNAPEYRIVESIYRKYKDQGFEVVAIPSNEFCGKYVIYDEFVDGINHALEAKNYAERVHDVSYEFAELAFCNPSHPMPPEIHDELFPDRSQEYPRQLKDGEETHPVFKFLCESASEVHGPEKYYMFGNFEKFLVGKDGKLVKKYHNGCLVPREDEPEYAKMFNLKNKKYDIQRYSPREVPVPDEAQHGESHYNLICSDIESLLEE